MKWDKVQESAEEEWVVDAGEGAEEMNFEGFFDSMFQLVSAW